MSVPFPLDLVVLSCLELSLFSQQVRKEGGKSIKLKNCPDQSYCYVQ